jgi:hypothetical protein
VAGRDLHLPGVRGHDAAGGVNEKRPVYRFRCPQCLRRFSWLKDSFTGRVFAAGQTLYCGECYPHRGGNCRLVLINETTC